MGPDAHARHEAARSGVLGVILYAIPILGILVVLPPSAVQNLSGFITASKTVFTVYGGAAGFMLKLMAFTFIMALISSGASWLILKLNTIALNLSLHLKQMVTKTK